jgi:hypothetical protein
LAASGSGIISIGGTHTLQRVIGFTSSSVGGTVHRLVIDLTSDGGGQMIGVRRAEVAHRQRHDEVSTASSSGFGIGAIAVRSSFSSADRAVVNVSTTISKRHAPRAGHARQRELDREPLGPSPRTRAEGSSTSAISTANMSLTNNVTTAIGSTARLIAAADAEILATGLQTANGESNNGRRRRDRVRVGRHDPHRQPRHPGRDRRLRVRLPDAALGEARNGLDLRDTSGADTGGLGADADANGTARVGAST